jgi:formate dehydrogenase major subunit
MQNHGCHPLVPRESAYCGVELPRRHSSASRNLYGNRADLQVKYLTHDDKKAFWRLPTLYKTIQQKNIADKIHEKSRWS